MFSLVAVLEILHDVRVDFFDKRPQCGHNFPEKAKSKQPLESNNQILSF